MTPDRGTAPLHGGKEKKKKLILKECETGVFLKQAKEALDSL
jgi:hypothetical protein